MARRSRTRAVGRKLRDVEIADTELLPPDTEDEPAEGEA